MTKTVRSCIFTSVLIASFFLILTGCGQVTVSQDYDPTANFLADKTFAWQEKPTRIEGDLLGQNDLLANRFRIAIISSLLEKGFEQTVNPAFLVSCSYVVATRLETEPYRSGVSYGIGRYGRYGGIGFGTGTQLTQYDQGRLTVYIHDASSGQLIWTGLATRQVTLHSTPQELTQQVNEMVSRVMSQFPPLKPAQQYSNS